jgi:type VI secretion system protein ImpH
MASESGKQSPDLRFEGARKLLESEPYSVRFFQAVRMLERLYPGRNPVGLFVTPSSEVIRFSSFPSLSFPASEIQDLATTAEGQQKVTVNFMGLSAAVGALPHPYTEFLLERIRAKDYAPGEFFDLFNHRIISLFYRAWQKYRFFVAYERNREGDDAVTSRLYDLLGMGTAGLKSRMDISDDACLYYAGILSHKDRTAMGLQYVLEDYFGVPVEVEQFTGSWNRLPPSDQTFLRDSGAFVERLGLGTTVGDEVWDRHGTVTIRLGPMNFERYQQFLPGARAYLELRSWLRFYSNREYDFVVQLVLKREEAPPMNLGEQGLQASRLGLVSWIKNRPLNRDPDEAAYRIN